MNKVNGYGLYQNNYYDTAVNKKSQSKTSKSNSSKTDKTRKTDNNNVQLSDRAKALLQELKKTYSNMDFMVADYESEEEAASYLGRGSKEYSVLIDPEELERMASDDNVKEQNLSILDNAVGKLDEMKNQLGDKENEVVRMGVSIGKNGEVSYFAELEKAGELKKEFVDRIRENKRKMPKRQTLRQIPEHTADMTMNTANVLLCMPQRLKSYWIRSKMWIGMISVKKLPFPLRADALILQSNPYYHNSHTCAPCHP